MNKEMNIEEAIEVCKELIAENSHDLLNCWDSGEEAKQAIETVLADRERLEEENKKLEEARNWYFEHTVNKAVTPEMLHKILRQDYIPKSVIKEKIEEFNKKLNILGGRTNGKQYTLYGKTLLQELLEESEEK